MFLGISVTADRLVSALFETYLTTSCSSFFLVAADFLPSLSVTLGLILCRVISSPALRVTKDEQLASAKASTKTSA